MLLPYLSVIETPPLEYVHKILVPDVRQADNAVLQ
jgi:hypothetical protein